MTVTVSPASTIAPTDVVAPLIYWRELWADPWELRPDFRLVSLTSLVAGAGVGAAEFRRPYGPAVKFEFSASFNEIAPVDILDSWIYVILPAKDGGSEVSWLGRVSTESVAIHAGGSLPGGAVDPAASGVQSFIAHEPLRMLERKPFARAVFRNGTNLLQDWNYFDHIPDMNAREPGSSFAGNMSHEIGSPGAGIAESHVFRGRSAQSGTANQPATKAEVWSHLDFLQYVFSWFADAPLNENDGTILGPYFQITGERQALAEMKTTIRFKPNGTVAEAVRKLIPLSAGFDFKILPILVTTGEGVEIPGFEVNVFATSPTPLFFGTASLPANTSTVSLNLRDLGSAKVQMATSLDNQYDAIRVRGERIVVCSTLNFRKPGSNPVGEAFVPGWDLTRAPDSPGLQLQYENGTGNESDDADAHDKARANPRFRDVYSRFVLPQNVPLQNVGLTSPFLASDGSLDGPLDDALRRPEFQLVYRELLPWIPLRNGLDYSTPVPSVRFDTAAQSGFRPLTLWIFDSTSADLSKGTNTWQLAADLGLSVSIDPEAYGILIAATPRHRLASNQFRWTLENAEFVRTATKSNHTPRLRYRNMMATVAIRTDHRLEVSVDFSPADIVNPERELVIDVPGAEMWVLSSDTVVEVDTEGNFVRRGPELLRDDSTRLHAVMAGAIGRYHNARRRAVVDMHGLQGWSSLLGKILTVVESPAQTLQVDAPITAIEYTASDSPRTVIKTGYAL